MLLAIRDKITGWLAYIIIFLISIPFALWGIQQYFDGGGSNIVATVDGQEIPARALDREYARYRQQLQAAFGGTLPGPLANDALLKQQVLNQMIERQVLLQVTHEEGYRVGDEQLGAKIRSMQEFQTDGQFDKGFYEAQLRSQGWSPAGFEAELRQAARQDQLRDGVVATSTVSRREIELLETLRNQERDIAYLRLPLENRLPEVTVSEERVREYYETHPAEFMRPEQVRIAYLELDVGDLAQDIDVSDETLRRLYEERAGLYGTPEERVARHILIKVPQDASDEELAAARQTIEDLRARIVAGEDFGEIAGQYSEDIGSKSTGGDLGAVTRGVMVEPFENALFAMQEGELSEPVRTRFGWHLIKLEEIDTGSVRPFEEVRGELAGEYRRQSAENMIFDRAEQLANLTYENPDSLVIAAETLGLKVEETGWVTRERGEGIAAEPRVRQAAFSAEVLQEGRNSDVLELEGGRLVVVRVKEHQEPEPEAFEAVADSIRSKLRRERAQELLRETGDQMLAALREGASPAQVAERFSAELEELGYTRRSAGGANRAIVDLGFMLPAPQAGGSSLEGLTLGDGDYAVVMLRDVRRGPAPGDGDLRVAQQRREQLAGVEYRALLQDYVSRADVQRRSLDEEQ